MSQKVLNLMKSPHYDDHLVEEQVRDGNALIISCRYVAGVHQTTFKRRFLDLLVLVKDILKALVCIAPLKASDVAGAI